MSRLTVAPVEELPGIRSGADLVRSIALTGIAGLVTGIAVGGLGARLFMRVAAAAAPDAAQGATTEADATVGAITFAGTMGIVVFVGIGAGIMIAVLFATYRPWLAWAGPLRGLAFGAVLLAVGSATSDVLNPDNFDFALLQNRVLVVSLILMLFVGSGVLMEPVVRFLDRRLPPGGGAHRGASRSYALIAGIGVVLALLMVPTFLFARGSCHCDPPYLASLSVVVTAAGTLVLWSWAVSGRSDGRRKLARFIGFAGLAGTLLFGLWRAGSDIVEILTAST